jgi:hypothetical protein
MPTLRQLLSCSLLATYAGIVMLGQGLHLLTPCCHHHDATFTCCDSHDHAHGIAGCTHHECSEHANDFKLAPAGPVIAASNCATSVHGCEICEFLFLAVTEPPNVASTPDSHVLVVATPGQQPRLYSSATHGLHTARGPPQLLA